MRSKYLFFTLACFILFGCKPEEVIKPGAPAGSFVFGGEGKEAGFGLLELSDGNLLIVGTAQLAGNEDYDLQLILVSPTGEEIWTRDFRNPVTNETGHRVVRTSGGYAIVGYLHQTNSSQAQGQVWLLDDNFEVVDQRTFPLASQNYRPPFISAFFESSSGGFVIGYGTGSDDNIVVLDQNLVTVAARQFYSGYNDPVHEFMAPVSGGFLNASIGFDYNSGGQQEIVTSMVDESGQVVWANSSPVDQSFYLNAINGFARLSSGNLVALVTDYSNTVAVVRMDSIGNVNSTTSLGVATGLSMIRELPSGNLLIGGNTSGNRYDYQNSVNDMVLTELDDTDRILWTAGFGGKSDDSAKDLIVTSTGNYVLTGSSFSYGLGVSDNFLVIYNR